MTEKIIKANKLIAEFDGKRGNPLINPREMHYHDSWDWLMPVVEKIEKLRMAYPKEAGWVCDCKIVVYKHILYREVVDFIKWYNKNKSQAA